jgi:putative nucleotidyltransferase with HDIG domain
MRPAWPVLGTTVVGCVLVIAGMYDAVHVSVTTLTLFVVAAILTELFEHPHRERSREPIENEPFRLSSVVHVAALLLLGPWVGALIAGAGVIPGVFVRRASSRTTAFRASAFMCATAAAGVSYRLAGGHLGRLQLLNALVPIVALGIVYLTVRGVLLDVVDGRESFDPRLGVGAGEVGFGTIVALLATTHPWDVVAVLPLAVAVHQTQRRLSRVQRETLRALETFANIVDERDPSTYQHSIRVAGYVDQLARALGLPFSDIDRLRWAGRLHDLGKVAVDSTVLRKPGQLSREEWASMRRHARLSARLLQRFDFVSGQARAVELHHERADGRGYYGVPDEDIPLAAHFLIVADSFDAMTTDRAYRRGLSKDEALDEIVRNMGTQFHPEVAAAFVAVQCGIPLEDVFTDEQLAQFRNAAVPFRIRALPRFSELKDRPELLALSGLVVTLVGLGFRELAIAIFGGALAVVGVVLYGVSRMRAERVRESISAAIQGFDRDSVFDALVAALEHAWPLESAVLVDWEEDGLGGRSARAHGKPPAESAVMSWLVRDADSGAGVHVAPGAEIGREGVAVALPLRRETSALAGFLVLTAPRLPARHVELAMLEAVDEVGLALAGRPESGGGSGEDAQAFEAVSDPADLVLVGFDER